MALCNVLRRILQRPLLSLPPKCTCQKHAVSYTPPHPTPSLQEPRCRAPLDDQRVPVHTGHQTQPNGSPYGLCDLPLVLGAQARVLGVLYPPRLGHVLGHDCEVLGAVSA